MITAGGTVMITSGGNPTPLLGGARLAASGDIPINNRTIRRERPEKESPSGSPHGGTWRSSSKLGFEEIIHQKISFLKTLSPEGDGEEIGEVGSLDHLLLIHFQPGIREHLCRVAREKGVARNNRWWGH